MELQVDVADGENGGDQNDADHDHQKVGVAWRGNKGGR